MRKKLFYFTASAVMLFFTACSSEDQIPEPNNETRMLSVSASMPEVGPTTRVDLEQDGKDVKLTWAVGDEIAFAYVQGTENATATVTVNSVSNGGKRAHFEIPIPTGGTGDFILYGVHGGAGINMDGTNPRAVLPNNAGNAGSLQGIENRNDVMLYFKQEMNVEDTDVAVNFKHIGSIFSINFNNLTPAVLTALNGVTEVRLTGVGGDGEWAFNAVIGTQGFDLETETFEDLTTAGNYLPFTPLLSNLIGETLTLKAWYPITGKVWPELELQMTILDGTPLFTSVNTRPERTTAPLAGKTYHFYVTNDGLDPLSFSFANDKYDPYPSN